MSYFLSAINYITFLEKLYYKYGEKTLLQDKVFDNNLYSRLKYIVVQMIISESYSILKIYNVLKLIKET